MMMMMMKSDSPLREFLQRLIVSYVTMYRDNRPVCVRDGIIMIGRTFLAEARRLSTAME